MMAGNQSLSRGLAILTELEAVGSSLGVREIGRRLGFSPAIAQRLLNTLAEEGFVQRDDESKKYALGFRALTLGSSLLEENRLLAASVAELSELAATACVNAYLCVPVGNELIYILALQSPGPISINAAPGTKAPFHATAVGKALLASFDEERTTAILSETPLEQLTAFTITEPDALRAQLSEFRHCGYATSIDENLPGVSSVSAVVRAANGEPVGAISVAYMPSVQTEITLPSLVQRVVHAARRISSGLGCPDSSLGDFNPVGEVNVDVA